VAGAFANALKESAVNATRKNFVHAINEPLKNSCFMGVFVEGGDP
jgi:hypothetical protein